MINYLVSSVPNFCSSRTTMSFSIISDNRVRFAVTSRVRRLVSEEGGFVESRSSRHGVKSRSRNNSIKERSTSYRSLKIKKTEIYLKMKFTLLKLSVFFQLVLVEEFIQLGSFLKIIHKHGIQKEHTCYKKWKVVCVRISMILHQHLSIKD